MTNSEKYNWLIAGSDQILAAEKKEHIDRQELSLLKASLRARIRKSLEGTVAATIADQLSKEIVGENEPIDVLNLSVLAANILHDGLGQMYGERILQTDLGL